MSALSFVYTAEIFNCENCPYKESGGDFESDYCSAEMSDRHFQIQTLTENSIELTKSCPQMEE